MRSMVFYGALIDLMRNLIDKAAYDPSKLMFGTDHVTTRSNHVDIVRFGPKGPSRL